MDDLTITRLCAEAMGWQHKTIAILDGRKKIGDTFYVLRDISPKGEWHPYDPLHDDAQAMALVKKCSLSIIAGEKPGGGLTGNWGIIPPGVLSPKHWQPDLNRAICECVSRMMKAKNG